MNRKKVLLIAQSILCVILVVMLITAALGIYREGLAQKAADPLSWIYTREKAAAALYPVLPLLALGLVLTAVHKYLDPLILQGRIALTVPDKPNSKNQKYVTIR